MLNFSSRSRPTLTLESLAPTMRAITMTLMALGFVLAGEVATWAGADTEPVIVVPGRPGVPIIIDGRDVRGAVIEGEWGLARGHTGITIIKQWTGYAWPHFYGPHGFGPRWVAPVGGYYPTAGKPP